jgi:hypothetical protein
VDSSSEELGSPAEPERLREEPPRLRLVEPLVEPPWLEPRSVISSAVPVPPPPPAPPLLRAREARLDPDDPDVPDRDDRDDRDDPDPEERPRDVARPLALVPRDCELRPELPPRELVLRERLLLEPRPVEEPRPDDDERLDDPVRRVDFPRPVDERLTDPRLAVERPRPPVDREVRPPRPLVPDRLPVFRPLDDALREEDERPLDFFERPPVLARPPDDERPPVDDRPLDDERDRPDEDWDRPLDEPPRVRPLPERLEPFRLAMTYPLRGRGAGRWKEKQSSPPH